MNDNTGEAVAVSKPNRSSRRAQGSAARKSRPAPAAAEASAAPTFSVQQISVNPLTGSVSLVIQSSDQGALSVATPPAEDGTFNKEDSKYALLDYLDAVRDHVEGL